MNAICVIIFLAFIGSGLLKLFDEFCFVLFKLVLDALTDTITFFFLLFNFVCRDFKNFLKEHLRLEAFII